MTDALDFFLELFKDLEAAATALFKSWDNVESVATRFLVFVENISLAYLNKWFPV